MLLAEYFDWTGDVALRAELWPAALSTLGWMTVAAHARAPAISPISVARAPGLANQGWKDASTPRCTERRPANPPIALAEVQGYQYAALRGMAPPRRAPGSRRARRVADEALRALRERFDRDFWMADEALATRMALDGEGRPCRVVTSNPGHLLWTRPARPARAQTVAARSDGRRHVHGLGDPHAREPQPRLQPMSYHTGSVWPHDTAIAAVGMRRYGLVEPFLTLPTALFEAVLQFEAMRMPELFCGFPRLPGYGPTRYPVACSPQAWSAGVVFQLIAAMMGLSASAEQNQLTLERPRLPGWLASLEVQKDAPGSPSDAAWA